MWNGFFKDANLKHISLKSAHGLYLVAEAQLPVLGLIIPGDVNANRILSIFWETFRVYRSGNLAVFQTFHNTGLFAEANGTLKHHGNIPFIGGSVFEIQCV